MSALKEDGLKEAERVPPAEWATAALGLIILLILLGALIYEATQTGGLPPEIHFSVVAVREQQSGYVVDFQVVNSGDTTAADLVVEATLTPKSGGAKELRRVTIDFLPASSRQRAGLFFQSNPNLGRLSIYPVGYREP